MVDIPPKLPSPTRIAGKRSARNSSHWRFPDGPGLATPPAVSINANGRLSLPQVLFANSCKYFPVIRTISSSITGRPSSAALTCGPAALRQAYIVCAHIGVSPSNGPDGDVDAATAACSPIVSTPFATRATNSASESSGNPVCTGLRNSVGVPARLAACASPPETKVLPTPVLAPHMTNDAVRKSTSASLAYARRWVVKRGAPNHFLLDAPERPHDALVDDTSRWMRRAKLLMTSALCVPDFNAVASVRPRRASRRAMAAHTAAERDASKNTWCTTRAPQ